MSTPTRPTTISAQDADTGWTEIHLPTAEKPTWRDENGDVITYLALKSMRCEHDIDALLTETVCELTRAALTARADGDTGTARRLVTGISLLLGEVTGAVGPASRQPAP